MLINFIKLAYGAEEKQAANNEHINTITIGNKKCRFNVKKL